MTLDELYVVLDCIQGGSDKVREKAIEIINREINLKTLNPVTGKFSSSIDNIQVVKKEK